MANYNNGEYIEECIISVLNQTSGFWELIIIDDKSNDQSLDIYKKYEINPKITIVFNKDNLGYIRTLKKLIKIAKTDIVGIIDPDDKLAENCVEVIMDYYNKNTETGFLYSNFWYCDEKLNIVRKGYCKKIPDNKTALKYDYVSHFKTFRKSVYNKTTGYDEKIIFAEDKDLILKMEEATKLHFVDTELYYYREMENSQSHGPRRKISIRNYKRAKRNARKRRAIAAVMRIINWK